MGKKKTCPLKSEEDTVCISMQQKYSRLKCVKDRKRFWAPGSHEKSMRLLTFMLNCRHLKYLTHFKALSKLKLAQEKTLKLYLEDINKMQSLATFSIYHGLLKPVGQLPAHRYCCWNQWTKSGVTCKHWMNIHRTYLPPYFFFFAWLLRLIE